MVHPGVTRHTTPRTQACAHGNPHRREHVLRCPWLVPRRLDHPGPGPRVHMRPAAHHAWYTQGGRSAWPPLEPRAQRPAWPEGPVTSCRGTPGRLQCPPPASRPDGVPCGGGGPPCSRTRAAERAPVPRPPRLAHVSEDPPSRPPPGLVVTRGDVAVTEAIRTDPSLRLVRTGPSRRPVRLSPKRGEPASAAMG